MSILSQSPIVSTTSTSVALTDVKLSNIRTARTCQNINNTFQCSSKPVAHSQRFVGDAPTFWEECRQETGW